MTELTTDRSNVYTESSRRGAVLPPRKLVRGSSHARSEMSLNALVSIFAWKAEKKGQGSTSDRRPQQEKLKLQLSLIRRAYRSNH